MDSVAASNVAELSIQFLNVDDMDMMSSDIGNSSRSKYDDDKIIYTVIGAIHAVRCCCTSRDSIWPSAYF